MIPLDYDVGTIETICALLSFQPSQHELNGDLGTIGTIV